MGGQRKAYIENKHGGGMRRSVSIYLRREDCGSCMLNVDLDAKRKAPHAVYTAKKNAEKEKFDSVKFNKENIFRFAKQMRTENVDVIGEKCIRGDNGNLSLDDTSKNLAWKRLFNTEFL